MIDYLDLLGIPFKTHGRSNEGLDCYGLLIEVAKRLGVDFPDAFYSDLKTRNDTYNFLIEKLPIKITDKLEKYCIIMMFKENNFSHVGVYLGEGKFIHATKDLGVCVQKLSDYERYRKVIYKIEGIKNGNN